MTNDYTAIRVTEGVKEAAQEAKQDGETWDEYVLRCTEHPPEVREFVDSEETGELLEGIQKAKELAEQARDNTEDIKQGLGR